jgi:hypothetical protein
LYHPIDLAIAYIRTLRIISEPMDVYPERLKANWATIVAAYDAARLLVSVA